jgi:hypothetical protein
MFGKKRLFGKMDGFVNIIAIAIAEAAWQQQKRLGLTEDRRIAAAVANLLIGRDSSHTDQEKRSAKQLAATMLREREDIRFAAVMCLRTTAVTGGTEAAIAILGTIDWISTLGEIPGAAPGPETMQSLAYDMAMRYCPNAVEIVK